MPSREKPYKPVSSKVNFPDLETSILERWREENLLRETERVRADAPLFVFYEGPPTANGSPGIHHVLSRSFKDVILRYKTMRGFRPLRRGGWDTHGLPVELEIEKELGISSKQEIEAFGVEEFNRRCRESVFRYVGDWEAMTERAGVWLDMDDAYVTYHNSYIESAWWVFKRLWDQGLVYEDYKVTPHCPRCVTSLSSHEVALGYQENTPDPSVYVRFPVSEAQSASDDADGFALPAPQRAATLSKMGFIDGRWTAPRPSFIAWTTTPWTLTANLALAVGPAEQYVLAESDADGERVIVASALAERVLGEGWKAAAEFSGADFTGVEYDAPYVSPSLRGHTHRALPAGYVTTADGTGVVHTAVAYGAEDAELGKARGFETVHTVDLRGVVADGFPGAGKFVKDADADIIRDLDERGLLFRDASPYRHTYPFCWRCGTPLLYYAKTSWHIRTTARKEEMVAGNRAINWVPGHIKEGRFGEWLRNNVDWSVSRERYWGTPIPIWRCADHPEHVAVAGSLADLAERVTDETRPLLDGLDLHRPFVDRVELRCECGGVMRRVIEVADAWYDSGAMPFAQWNYPVTVKGPGGAELTLNGVDDLIASPLFPANYITEAVDQTRGWFYSLLALSTLIAGKPSYESCLVLGLILDGNGEKMSKSRGNVVDPWSVMNEHGADALRWYLFTAAPAADARRFSSDLVKETLRQFLLTLWNTYSFFVTYANIDGFDPSAHAAYWKDGQAGSPALASAPPNELDRWIISELNGLAAAVAADLDALNPTGAGRRIQEFVNLLSNWYVRRSRRRFWKAENDDDKAWAHRTLYSCLLTLAKLIAPLTPFTADEMFRNLAPSGAARSVHLEDFPEPDASLVDDRLNKAARLAMRIASLGRNARSRSGVKVRQPLSRVLVHLRPEDAELLPLVAPQILDELNVKAVETAEADAVAEFSIKPNLPVLGPKLGARIGEARSAVAAADASAVAGALRSGSRVEIGGFAFEPGDLLVETADKPGVAAAADGALIVGMDVALTPELRAEGVAREFVHCVQNMRKAAGFEIEDRIVTYVAGSGADGGSAEETLAALAAQEDYVRQETLSGELRIGEPPPSAAHAEEREMDGATLIVGVARPRREDVE